ncbi:hypothetical protein CA984_14875 [Streptosporangium minutum]|uniref:Uncharacterized protein n=1 Tax=Streptosporangium minutum TaxID=569862 RepID=A0A243RNG2_9ACTN|nr:hypothetical protein CA984_14875 [Streptosporangium minutum]
MEVVPPQLRTPRPAAWWIVPVTLLVGGVVGGAHLVRRATSTKTALFARTVVVDPAAAHVWSDGWRLKTTPEGTGHLVREKAGSVPVGED